MSLQTHIEQLEQRHQALDSRLNNLASKPASDNAELYEIKRQKLQLKDEIARLRGELV